MASNQEVQYLEGKWIVEGEFTITTAGAIVPNADLSTTTDPRITATLTGTGTYRLDIPGNFYKTVCRDVRYHGSAASSVQAQITAIGLGTGTVQAATGEATTTVTIITGNSNAVPAAANQASGTISFRLAFLKNKF